MGPRTGVTGVSTADIDAVTTALVELTAEVIRAEEAHTPAVPRGMLPALAPSPGLAALIARAELAAIDVAILRVLLAAEVEPNAYRALQRLAGDPTQHGVAVDALVVAMRAFGAAAVDVLHALRPTAPLVERGIVRVHGDAHQPPLVRRLTLPPRLVDHVITGALPPELDEPHLVAEPARPVAELCAIRARDDDDRGGAVIDQLRRLLPAALAGEAIWLTGPRGIGRKTLLAAAAAELGRRVLVLGYEDALRARDEALVATLWCEVLIGDAILCIADADARLASRESGGDAPDHQTADPLAALYRALRRARLPMVFTSDLPPASQDLERPPQILRFGAADPADAVALWRAQLPDAEAPEQLATRFKLTPGRIVRTAEAAVRVAQTHGRTAVADRDVAQAITLSVAQQVAVLGNLVEDTQTWADIVLPEDTRDSVREMIARVRHRHTVLDDWGFRAKMSKGLGMAALFSGPPGTGKTMVASLIARELGQELYQIELSRVVSKWIGETEKNLARVFDAAEGANVLLLFDEADSMFAKRTEVKTSTDRHSNAEVNYLLQRVERFEGICILTTNFEGSIDPAFKRRLAFRMTFPLPDEAERTQLWKRMMPKSANVAPDVDFEELGAEYELAGGNIRNAVLRAAFFAASESQPITQELLVRSVRLEYRDAGKFTTAGRIA